MPCFLIFPKFLDLLCLWGRALRELIRLETSPDFSGNLGSLCDPGLKTRSNLDLVKKAKQLNIIKLNMNLWRDYKNYTPVLSSCADCIARTNNTTRAGKDRPPFRGLNKFAFLKRHPVIRLESVYFQIHIPPLSKQICLSNFKELK